MDDEAEGIMLSSLNGAMWDLFKAIIRETESDPSTCDVIKGIAERGLEMLRCEAL
jgi:hypothetical protein